MRLPRALFPQLAAVALAWLASFNIAIAQNEPPEGFTALFNGADLSGWRGGTTFDPAKLAAMPEAERVAQIETWTKGMTAHWRVENGELVNDGEGDYATTEKDYGDFELRLEYKTVAGADSGIYLRGCPQVQIWDINQPSKPENPDRNPNKGSGGLFNNTPRSPGRDPLAVADRPFGEWNQFRIVMVDTYVSVWLNDQLVVDRAVMENYFDPERKLPVPRMGPIQLQTHGGQIRWRNIVIREIAAEEADRILGDKPRNAANANKPLIFISSFAGGDKGAIHACELNASGLKVVHRTGEVENPFFIALAPNGKHLYSIHAPVFSGTEPEHVAAYALEGRTGRMRLLNRQSTRGTASCYLDLDNTGKTLLVANYTSGSVASLPVKDDGSLGEAASFFQYTGSSVNPDRQKEPHAHSFIISLDNRHAFAADLGTDQVLGYKLDAATAKLTPTDPPFAKTPPGSGPRHLTFHPNGKHLYAINELLNTVTVFDYAAESGGLEPRQTISTLPEDFKGESYTADLKIAPDGRFLYGTNRGHDSIAAYKIGDDGRLSLIAIEPSLGKGPQNLLILPGGQLLLCANMPGDNVALFRIDGETGRLKQAGEPLSLTSPSCIRLLP